MTIRGTDHLSHQFSQIKATKKDIDWTWLIQHRRGFNTTPRGNFLDEFGVNKVPYYESGKYDLAILHLDQQCLDDVLFDIGKGSLYKDLNTVIQDIPKVVICHGTPYWPERFTDEELCKKMKVLIGINKLIVNSYTARLQWAYGVKNSYKIIDKAESQNIDFRELTKDKITEWGFKNIGVDYNQMKAIWHGINKDEFPVKDKEPRVVTFISSAGLDKYYDRAFFGAVKDRLSEKGFSLCHISVDASFKTFEEYSDFLSRSLIYFNPTKESCMPRSRTEAMLAGCCVVTTGGQDIEKVIEQGKSGFIVPRNVDKTVELIEGLIIDYKTAERIGKEGHKTAVKLFNPERYNKEFLSYIKQIITKVYDK